jgi:hypothetical protein
MALPMRADEHAPEAVKSIWISIFLMAIPVGYACGYIFGATVGLRFGWRLAFLLEASLMVPFLIFAFCSTPIPFGQHAHSSQWQRQAPARTANGVAGARGLPAEEPLLWAPGADDGGATSGGLARGGSEGRAKGSLVQNFATVLRCGLQVATDVPQLTSQCPHSPLALCYIQQRPRFSSDSRPADVLICRASTWVLSPPEFDNSHLPQQPLFRLPRPAMLCRCPAYTFAVLGNTMQCALLGMFAYWGPKAVTYMFHLHTGSADVIFGAVTVLSGITGTLGGGLILDALGGHARDAAAICFLSCAGGFVLMQAAFRLCFSLVPFVAVFAVGEFVLFLLQSPCTRIILMSVPQHLQPLAFSIQTISIHVFGDVPSPPLAGWIHDQTFHADDIVRSPFSPFSHLSLL